MKLALLMLDVFGELVLCVLRGAWRVLTFFGALAVILCIAAGAFVTVFVACFWHLFVSPIRIER
jgi:hypothetical protein